MSEEGNKEKGEEKDKGGDPPGVEKSTAETLIEKTNELSKDRDRLNAENDDSKMQIAAHQIGGKSSGGTSDEKEYTDEEKASRERIKKIGDMTKSPWAKNYE